jgi:hypothetical protein
MGLSISIVPEGFAEAEKMLRGIKDGFPKAAANAINVGLVAARKVAVQKIRQRYAIAASALKGEGMKVKKASWAKIAGLLEAKGPMLPVALFSASARWRRIGGRRIRVVSAKIIKGQRKIIKGAFMPKAGKVMERRQPVRLPIFPVYTIGVPYMVRKQNIQKQVQVVMAKATQKRLDHNVQHLLRGGKLTR